MLFRNEHVIRLFKMADDLKLGDLEIFCRMVITNLSFMYERGQGCQKDLAKSLRLNGMGMSLRFNAIVLC
jgi:TPR repeat protein